MDIWHLFSLFGGLALFLFGMNLMSEGLELVAGQKMQQILQKLTTNRFLGLLVGLVVTAVIQSSSATTVMVVGFVNSNLMNLTQAVNVIMGANIGTTITGQLIALNVTKLAPLIAFAGFILSMTKIRKSEYFSKVIMGLGFLFMGLQMMSDSMKPLQSDPAFHSMMLNISNPFMGIVIGAVFTAIIQSSSASVGILQTMAASGLVPFSTAMYIVLGQNIGTCITSVISSFNTSRNAKRAATSHVLFNLIGTMIFVLISYLLPLQEWIVNLTPDRPTAQIANLHTIFNVVTSLLMLPFARALAKLSTLLIKGEDEVVEQRRLVYLKPNSFGDNVVMLSNIRLEIIRMLDMTHEIFTKAASNFKELNEEAIKELRETAVTLNYLDKEVTKIAVVLLSRQLGQAQSEALTNYIRVVSNLDRIGDYSLQIVNIMQQSHENEITYSETAENELRILATQIEDLFAEIKAEADAEDINTGLIYDMQDKLEFDIDSFRDLHIVRMREGLCGAEAGLNFDKCLSHMQRIGDHLVTAAESLDI